ncbi:MAG: tetratricopeptide repeat protein, partial [Vampirovibrionales bacterium]|nr:tetratricopeptide repeat protein [Vampirovibrionales bacterium]
TLLVLSHGSGAVFFALSTSSESQFDQGLRASQRGQLSQAMLFFQQATQAEPSNLSAWFNLGSVHYQMRAFDAAMASLQRVLQANPDDAQARYLFALSQAQLGLLPEAIASLDKISEKAPLYAQAQAEARQLQFRLKNPNVPQGAYKPMPPSLLPTANKPQPLLRNADGTVKVASAKAASSVLFEPKSSGKKAPVETIVRGLSGPTGMAFSPDGNLFVANYSKNSIEKITPGGVKSVLIEGKGLLGPVGVVRHPASGDLIVANYLGNNLVRVSSATGKLSELAGGLKKPYCLTLDASAGVVYVTEQGTNTISRIVIPK